MQLSFFEEHFDPRSFNAEKIDQLSGLSIEYDFISLFEEQRLIEIIDELPWLNDLSRRVQHYGFKYNYKARNIDKKMYIGDLPVWLRSLAEKMLNQNLINFMPDQAIINEYESGQGIAAHIDCEPCFGDTIISLSLGSSAVMNFEREPNSKQRVEIFLEPRSLIIMQDESRFNFYHSINARKKDNLENNIFPRLRRISVTFRKVIT